MGSSQEDDEISEVESCSSAVSASKPGQAGRRSTRRKMASKTSDQGSTGAKDVKTDQVLDKESCIPVVSETKRVTRSQRKTRTRSSAKQTEDSEVSDADSCVSSVSGAEVLKSTTRSAAKSRRQTNPIPIHLDESSERSGSPAPTTRQTRSTRKKASVSVEGSEPPSCDSEGFESGPSYSIATRRRGKAQPTGPKPMDSDSDLTDVHSPVGSPCSTRSKGTPCSSRTGSWNSSRNSAVKDLYIVLEQSGEPSEEDRSLNESRLESTVIAEDADCTLLEESQSQTVEEEKDVNIIDLTSKEADTKRLEEDVVVSEPAVMVRDQQEEQSAENKDVDASEMEVMQEEIRPPEPLKPCQSITVTVYEKAPEVIEEKDDAMEVADVDAPSSQGDKTEDEDAVMETQPSVEEKIEVSPLNTDAQQVVGSGEVQVDTIQVTSSQQHKITVDSDPEPQPKDVIVHKTKVISLLDSSDDEDEFDEEEEESDVDAEEDKERAGPSKKSGPAAAAVEGLFMIDTRPGQEADEDYYTERPTEQEEVRNKDAEQEEGDDEFVDEEGDDDDDDDANLLFWSRNPQL